jgi:hypothetical protein
MLFCRVGSPRFATASKKGKSDHVPETGTPQNGRGREVHAWQTLTGEVAKDFPSVTETAGGHAGRFCVRSSHEVTPVARPYNAATIGLET